jgi:hypothetical protein
LHSRLIRITQSIKNSNHSSHLLRGFTDEESDEEHHQSLVSEDSSSSSSMELEAGRNSILEEEFLNTIKNPQAREILI